MTKNKLNLKYPVIVEGKYDKIKLDSILSSPIIVLDGFGFFNNTAKIALLRRYARAGAIILTDSDKAGGFIRARLKGIAGGELINLYTPVVLGREKRKSQASADGIIGVEGVDIDVLYALLEPYEQVVDRKKYMTTERAYADGLAGAAGCSALREGIAAELGLPSGLSPKAFYQALNDLFDEDEYIKALKKVTIND